MSAAGREMGLSPAVVSKRISLLEDQLGARLFQRTTRQLTLTETGEGYFKRVVDILSLVEEAEDFVSRRNTSPRGQLKVTAPTSFSRLHIAPYLPEFIAQYPDIALDFQLTDNMTDIIRDGFDLAIRIGELQDSSLVFDGLRNKTNGNRCKIFKIRQIRSAYSGLDRGAPVLLPNLLDGVDEL